MQMIVVDQVIHECLALFGVLGGQRATAKQESAPVGGNIESQTFPEKKQDLCAAVLLGNAGASDLHGVVEDAGRKPVEIEFNL